MAEYKQNYNQYELSSMRTTLLNSVKDNHIAHQLISLLCSQNPTIVDKVLTDYFSTLHNDVFKEITPWIHENMTEEDHDFSPQKFYEIYRDFEKGYSPLLGIEPERVLRATANTMSTWSKKNFKFKDSQNVSPNVSQSVPSNVTQSVPQNVTQDANTNVHQMRKRTDEIQF